MPAKEDQQVSVADNDGGLSALMDLPRSTAGHLSDHRSACKIQGPPQRCAVRRRSRVPDTHQDSFARLRLERNVGVLYIITRGREQGPLRARELSFPASIT